MFPENTLLNATYHSSLTTAHANEHSTRCNQRKFKVMQKGTGNGKGFPILDTECWAQS